MPLSIPRLASVQSARAMEREEPSLSRPVVAAAVLLLLIEPPVSPLSDKGPFPPPPVLSPCLNSMFHDRDCARAIEREEPSSSRLVVAAAMLLLLIAPPRSLAAIILDRSQQRSFAAKSYQQQSFAAIGLHCSPQQSFAANYLDHGQHRSEHDQQWSLIYTAAALLRNSRAHRYPVFLLLQPHPCCNQHHLQPRSRSTAVANIAAALFFLHHHCCLPTQISRLPSSDRYQPPEKIAASTILQHYHRTAADITAAIFFLHRCCYPWLPSFTWRLHHRIPDIAAIRYLQPENCSCTLQLVYLTGWRSLRYDIGGLIRSQIGGFRAAYGC
ncbi:hypothetical protein BHE74_00039064 [Ensete ventricosum]|nr:hypothetical protein BHE74_00039064 [Ensete ventricosum]RZS15576.1 hypothetical protein BHM03_00047437 [Ensete ventricosum]